MLTNTCIGIGTFGNLEFTKLAVQSVEDTTNKLVDFFLVVGKPEDEKTIEWLKSKNIPHSIHSSNRGFPASVNDIYDYAWGNKAAYDRYLKLPFNGGNCNLFVENGSKFTNYSYEDFCSLTWLNNQFKYDNLIIMGNDVLAYPYAIDNLIHVAETTDYDWVCPREVSVFTLLKAHPELKELFAGRELRITPEDLQKRPWEAFDEYKNDPSYCDIRFSQTHNMCLYKKSVFDKVGYIDVNFYPAYFEDNDLVKRALLTDLKSCTLNHTFYFHFWSRTINQETGGSNSKFFSLNSNFYIKKWGGPFLKETYSVPFNGESNFFNLGGIKIDSREREQEVINYWKETK